MIPFSRLFEQGKGNINQASGNNPPKAQMLIIRRIAKQSYPPEPDDCVQQTVQLVSPKGKASKQTTVAKSPQTGKDVVDDGPIIIRRKK